TFVLDLNTHDLFAALRGANEIKPQLEIELVLEDENGGAEDFTVTVCRQEVKVIDEINKESNTTAQNVDWLRAPDGTTYKPYGAGQIITGSQHYVATFGDASNTSFTFNHNLNTQDVHVTVRDNSTGDILEGAAFDSNITGVNSLDVSTIFTPASNGCAIVITSAGPASAFQAHSHAIAEVDLLQGVLDDLGLRLQVVESLVPTGAISSSISTATSEVAKWKLPEAFEVYPKRGEITGTKVSDIDQSTLPRAGGRLLPAVFDAAPTVVTDLPGSPALNKAYRLATGNLTLPGYRGIRSREIGAFDYFAWDGLGFYQVENVFSADLHEVALADWLTDGTDDAVFSFADEKPQLGENKVGLVKLRGVGLEIPQLVDGWYPYKSDDDGDTMTVIGTTMGADSGTLNTYETAAFTSSNEVVNVTEALIETGGTAMTLEIPGSSVHSDAGARFLFMHVEVNDAGTTGLTTGIHKFYNLGNDSDSWAAVTSGLNDGTLACDLDVTYPKTLQTFEDVDSGEVNRFYPVDFKRELFKVHVNDKQLRLKSKLELDFSLEMAALLADTDVQWGVVVQTGEIITDLLDSGNNGEGREIAGIRWNRPSLDQVVHLTDVVATHNFGLRVYRSSDNEITCSSVEYGQEYGGVQAPSNPNFVVRGLLHRFDVGELNESATGMVAYSGLSVDGEAGGEASITA
ncbi:MAG: hypothetical protein GY872_01580, partial [Roseibacillus sp.]|nr:hypothetical protein [Roseibacillus sp.]